MKRYEQSKATYCPAGDELRRFWGSKVGVEMLRSDNAGELSRRLHFNTLFHTMFHNNARHARRIE